MSFNVIKRYQLKNDDRGSLVCVHAGMD